MKKIITICLITIFFVLCYKNFCIAEEKCLYVLPEEYNRTEKDLEIVFLNVGQGDCAFVLTPNKQKLLIDAGGSPYWMGEDAWDPGENVVVPYLKSRGVTILDYVIVSHPHGDHFGGMFSVINSFKIKNFVDNGYLNGDPNYADLLKLVDVKEIPYEQLKEGDEFELEPQIKIKTFFPPKKGFLFEGANNSSLVFKICYNKFSILFVGDIELEVEQYLCSKYKNDLQSVVLKVPHHGSRTSSSVRFIKTVKPQVGIICCGKNNMFGHPHNEVISRYNKFKVDIYRTDVDDDIIILSNGEIYTVIVGSDENED